MLEEEVVQSDNITSVEYLKRLKPHVVKDQRVQCCQYQIKCQKCIYISLCVFLASVCLQIATLASEGQVELYQRLSFERGRCYFPPLSEG